MIGGLVSATVVTLLVFPAIYSLAHRRRASPGFLEASDATDAS